MATLQEDQTPVDREIVLALIDCAPPRWSTIELDAEQVPAGGGEVKYLIKLHSPEQHGDVAIANDALLLAIRKLALIFAKHGHPWKRIKYSATRDADGAWDFQAEYIYD
jgi:hypothetical protein